MRLHSERFLDHQTSTAAAATSAHQPGCIVLQPNDGEDLLRRHLAREARALAQPALDRCARFKARSLPSPTAVSWYCQSANGCKFNCSSAPLTNPLAGIRPGSTAAIWRPSEDSQPFAQPSIVVVKQPFGNSTTRYPRLAGAALSTKAQKQKHQHQRGLPPHFAPQEASHPVSRGSPKKKGNKYDSQQLAALEGIFATNRNPTGRIKEELSKRIDIPERSNKRAKIMTGVLQEVEGSFSTQAAHDILAHGVHPSALQHYNRIGFPGAVPRSFIDPLLLAIITNPLSLIGQAVGLVRSSADVQTITHSSCSRPRRSPALATPFTPPKLPQREAWIHRACFDVITALQFLFLLWTSRTTPKSKQHRLTLRVACGLAHRCSTNITPRSLHGISHITFLAATLRLELAGFLIPASVLFLAGVGAGSPDRLLRLSRLLRAGLLGGLAGTVSSVVVDTYFWRGPGALLKPRQWLWPEPSGLLFTLAHLPHDVPSQAPLRNLAPPPLDGWTVVTRLQPQADCNGKGKSVPPVNKRLPNMIPIRWLLGLCAGHIGLLFLLGHKEWRLISDDKTKTNRSAPHPRPHSSHHGDGEDSSLSAPNGGQEASTSSAGTKAAAVPTKPPAITTVPPCTPTPAPHTRKRGRV
ncbi:hypothetical protein V8E36_003452 [Tilletia maclaganii]